MKITYQNWLHFILALLLLTGTIFAGRAQAQAVKVNFSGRNIPLEKIFSAFKKQTGYSFFYNDQDLARAKPVTIELKNVPLAAAMDRIMAGQPLLYSIQGNTVFIKVRVPGPPVPGGSASSADNVASSAGTIDIDIKVINADNAPLAGATIEVRGNNKRWATTDINGKTVLKAVDSDAVIIISYTGYLGEGFTARGIRSFVIRLQPAVSQLDETVVQGYGREKKRDLIGTISRVTAKDIQNQPVSNVLSAIQGMIPGAEISNSSGTPGAPVQIRLRGINTMNDINNITSGAGFVALILIDGVPVTDLSFLSPSDIESVEVLKDAAATAIYGSRGAGGVILITTKKGARGNGSGKLSLNAYNSFTSPTRTAKMLNTDEYRTIRKEGYANDNIAINPVIAPDLYMDSTVNTNWSKYLYKNSLTQDYQLNFSGGSPTINYYISGGYRKEGAIVRGDWYLKRANGRMGLDAKISDHLSAGGNIAYTSNTSNLYPSYISSMIYYAIPLIPGDSGGNPNIKAYLPPYLNPNRQLTTFTNARNNQFIGNFYFNYQIWRQLFFRTDISTQQMNGQSTLFSPTTSGSFSTSYTGYLPSGTYGNTSNNVFTVEPQLNYSIHAGKHAIKLLAGGTLIDRTIRTSSLSMTGYSSNQLTTLADATIYTYSNYKETPYKFASAFGRASYNYNGKYLAEGVFRRDGSSRFGADYKYGNFWSAGAGWVFTQESFIQNLLGRDVFGKLKITYGITGNDNIGDFGYLSYSNASNYGGQTATYVNNLANPYLKWEQTRKLDFGLDLSILQNRLTITANYFRHRTDGTLFNEALSAVTGFSSISANLNGAVTNDGFELAITAVVIRTKVFKWTSMFNISLLKNKLVSLPGLSNLPTYYQYTFKVGQPLALNWGFKYLGVDPATGLAKFKDVDHSGTIAAYTPDWQVLGKSIPDYYGGWNNTFTYKRMELQVFAQYVSGIQKGYTTYTSFIGDNYNLPVSALGRWQKPGDITNIPRAAAPGTLAAFNNGNLTSSSFAYCDASYIRMKSITLGYNLPFRSGSAISSLRIFATSYNLFTITKYKGDDPESGPSTTPLTKNYTLGVNITL